MPVPFDRLEDDQETLRAFFEATVFEVAFFEGFFGAGGAERANH